jgi:hypothetical protein
MFCHSTQQQHAGHVYSVFPPSFFKKKKALNEPNSTAADGLTFSFLLPADRSPSSLTILLFHTGLHSHLKTNNGEQHTLRDALCKQFKSFGGLFFFFLS